MEKEIKEEELFIPKTKHKALKIILAIMLIGALAAGGYFIYKEKFDNPNKIVISAVDDVVKETKNNFDSDGIYKFNGILKVDAKLSDELKPITDIIKNFDIQFVLETDVKNKLFNTTINAKYKKEQLMDISLYKEGNAEYILLQDVYDKYLKVSLDDITKSKNENNFEIDIDENDIKIIFNSILNATKKSLNNLEFKRVSTTIKIDGNERNVYNNYVELKDTEIKKLIKDIVNTLSNDSEFTKVFKKLAGNDASITDLTNALDKENIPGTYTLSFYTDKNLLNQKLVSIRLETTNDGATTSINLDKVNDNETIFTANTSGGTISSRIKKTNSVFNISLNANILGMTVKLELSSNYEKIKEVTKPDISDSKRIEELTEEEGKVIEEKLQNNKGVTILIEDISKIKTIQ